MVQEDKVRIDVTVSSAERTWIEHTKSYFIEVAEPHEDPDYALYYVGIFREDGTKVYGKAHHASIDDPKKYSKVLAKSVLGELIMGEFY